MVARQLALLSFLLLASFTLSARADQPRDWVLNGAPLGNHFYFDYYGQGAQLSIEHRGGIYGENNAYTLNASVLSGAPFGQAQVTASLRIVILELSLTGGYRTVWRNLSFEPGDNGEYCKACNREARRDRDPLFDSTDSQDAYPYAEGTASLVAPLNDNMLFATYFTAHYEDSRTRSYDNSYVNIHDGGWMYIWEASFFLKHRSWGGIGPYAQLLWLPRNGKHEVEFAAGLNALTRLGLIKRNDVLIYSLLMRPDDDNYGQHWYYLPVRAILGYRMQFDL